MYKAKLKLDLLSLALSKLDPFSIIAISLSGEEKLGWGKWFLIYSEKNQKFFGGHGVNGWKLVQEGRE